MNIITQPYIEAGQRFKAVCHPDGNLLGRTVHLITALLLLIPILNIIMMLFFKTIQSVNPAPKPPVSIDTIPIKPQTEAQKYWFMIANHRLKRLVAMKAAEKVKQSNLAEFHREELKKLDEGFLNHEKVTAFASLSDLWKLGVDGQDHDKGRMSYDVGTNTYRESEPGYIDAMETSLGFMFHTADEPVTVEYIQQLRFLSCSGVRMQFINHDDFETEMKCQFVGRLPLKSTITVTKEGLLEMLSYDFFAGFFYIEEKYHKLTIDNVDLFLDALKSKKGSGEAHLPYGTDPSPFLFRFIEEYERNIKNASSERQKILTIATFLKKMETLHPFNDGNLRTVRLLLLKLLIQNKLPLSCIMNPNIIDGHSSKQVAEEIVRGMEVYKKIMPTHIAEQNVTG